MNYSKYSAHYLSSQWIIGIVYSVHVVPIYKWLASLGCYIVQAGVGHLRFCRTCACNWTRYVTVIGKTIGPNEGGGVRDMQ